MLIKFLGITFLLIVPPLFIFIYLRESKKEKPEYNTKLLAGFLLVGAALIFYQRLTGLSNPYLGTIKMASENALSYEQDIKMIKERVENQSATIDLIAKRSLNEIQPEILRVTDEVKKFERFINDMNDNLQKEYKTVSDELARIKLLNSLAELGDKAISEHDREAYEEIVRITQMIPENSSLKKAAIEEMLRVRATYIGLSIGRLGPLPSLTVTLEDGAVRKDQDIPTTRLLISLSDPNWKVRTASASLLGGEEKKVFRMLFY